MQVMIFGARSIALGVCRAIQELYRDCEVAGFLVTSRVSNPAVLAGLPVYELRDFADKSVCVVIATPENTHAAIVKNLEEHGFYNHFCIDSQKESSLMGKYYAVTGKFKPLRTANEKRINMLDRLLKKEAKLAVIGLGYVGIPLAVTFAKKLDVIGFDLNEEKIRLYQQGIDPTKEAGDCAIRETSMKFTAEEKDLREADFFIVAVPTPVQKDKTPDLTPVLSASEIVGRNMKKGAVIVYESTVYPGVTEEECAPVLERESGLKCGVDFKLGYSPERINPCDKEHVLSTIVKVVSGMDEETLDIVASVYELVALAGVYRAESIKVAEAAKVIENSQRDINIAFMNELSIIFHKMGIDTKAVLEAAGTKWNFLHFQPGLVGGHCIGVDPYYLTHKAALMGYHSQVILSGRRINDDMGRYVAEHIVKALIKADVAIKTAKVVILGFAFKENCQDTRNTKVIDIIRELRQYGIEPIVSDDMADREEAERLYGIKLVPMDAIGDMDVVAVCVQHKIFRDLNEAWFQKGFAGRNKKLFFDLKGMYDKNRLQKEGYDYWRL